MVGDPSRIEPAVGFLLSELAIEPFAFTPDELADRISRQFGLPIDQVRIVISEMLAIGTVIMNGSRRLGLRGTLEGGG